MSLKSMFAASLIVTFTSCFSSRILAIFPYNGRSHHIFYSALVEELASRNHQVTVVNYLPVKNISKLRQIALSNQWNQTDTISIKDHLNGIINGPFKELFDAYDTFTAFKFIANTNCENLVANQELREEIEKGTTYDLVIVEQFVTDCGLAIAHKFNASIIGIAAHVMMPWTYSRLGAPNNPAFVPNHFFASGTQPDIWSKCISAIINVWGNLYYRYVIQTTDQAIISKVYPDTPDLEELGRKISLMLLNQYFPLTRSRLYGANVIEVGGLHIKPSQFLDKELKSFLDGGGGGGGGGGGANDDGVVYISFGSVASTFPTQILHQIMEVINNSTLRFVWRVDDEILVKSPPENAIIRTWLPQIDILCHPNTKAFISHSGMLSSSEAIHCGVPLVAVPLFGDQFANAASAVECGLGVVQDIRHLTRDTLEEKLAVILQTRYQRRAKELSRAWRDRPLSPMDTAIFWIEFISRHRGHIELRPPTANLSMFQYLLLDVLVTILLIFATVLIVLKLILVIILSKIRKYMNVKRKSQ